MAAPTARGALASGLLGLALVLAACRGAAPELPVEGHHELCCKTASPDNVSFVGCRAARHCRAGESVWVRGPVRCTPAGVKGCASERCCTLAVHPLGAAGSPEPDSPEPDSPEPASPEPSAPEPAPIEIVPLDWQPPEARGAD